MRPPVVLNAYRALIFQWVKSVLHVEQKTPKINIVKIYFILIQHVGKMMMTDENAKTSRFPRIRRPAVRVPIQEDP
ncbi:hypothetical protein DLY41_05230 [Escherichia coli]|nr:hypothetical protein [Escherichia coli]EGD5096519.1 hypothetical protein [Escherichia coli]PBQ65519.1 hypothetical protein COD48_25440 [Escherichia coli]QHR43874.1 hypothetical protein FNE84_08585 [Escherichia coli]TGD16611.1 hypothetical protein DXT70_02630 [Escherichia coli]